MKTRSPWPILALALALLGLAWLPLEPRVAAQPASPARPGEAIVLPGTELEPFWGAGEDELWAWSWDGTRWRLVAEQLDEREGQQGLVASEDGQLDADDELVLMLDDAGRVAPEDERPPSMPQGAPRAIVALSDPLDAGYAGQIQLFRSAVGPEIAIRPRLRWDAEAREIVGDHYRLGPADAAEDGFFGIRSLYLPGREADLVDRFKIRGVFGGTAVNEETLAQTLAVFGVELGGDPLKTGPLRAVLGGGFGFAYDRRFAIFGAAGELGELGAGIPGLDFADARLSLDFSPAAAGATYHDANGPDGVPVDGSPDAVPDMPVPAWRELRLPEARLSLLGQAVDPSSAARAYYRDEASGGAGDTGDGMAYADLGVTAPDLGSLLETGFPGDILVLPAAGAATPEQLLAWREQPISVTLSFDGLPPTETPAPSATAVPPTATSSPSPTGAADTPTVPTPVSVTIHLPFALNRD